MLFIGDIFLKNCYNNYLRDHQKLYIVGAFEGEISDTAWFVTMDNHIQPDSAFLSNAEETNNQNKKHQNSCIVYRHGCLHDWHNLGMSTIKRCHNPN